MSIKILGVDCGSALVGWGLLNKEGNNLEHLQHGVIETMKGDDMHLRLKKIYEEFSDLLSQYQPDHVAIEDLFFFRNKTTVITVAQARGILLLATAMHNLPQFDYTPLQIKAAVTGYGRAEKKQVAFMVGKILKLDKVPELDDITDAIAVAVCHANTYKFLK